MAERATHTLCLHPSVAVCLPRDTLKDGEHTAKGWEEGGGKTGAFRTIVTVQR